MARHHNIYYNRSGRYPPQISISTQNMSQHLLTVTITILIITLTLLNHYKVCQLLLMSMGLGGHIIMIVMAIAIIIGWIRLHMMTSLVVQLIISTDMMTVMVSITTTGHLTITIVNYIKTNNKLLLITYYPLLLRQKPTNMIHLTIIIMIILMIII